ncbi:MAG: twin-arginine translocation signal domain-containing protein [Collinsella sp.]
MFNINSTLSRRNFLAGAAALGSTVALAGCSSGGSDGGSADDGAFKMASSAL